MRGRLPRCGTCGRRGLRARLGRGRSAAGRRVCGDGLGEGEGARGRTGVVDVHGDGVGAVVHGVELLGGTGLSCCYSEGRRGAVGFGGNVAVDV